VALVIPIIAGKADRRLMYCCIGLQLSVKTPLSRSQICTMEHDQRQFIDVWEAISTIRSCPPTKHIPQLCQTSSTRPGVMDSAPMWPRSRPTIPRPSTHEPCTACRTMVPTKLFMAAMRISSQPLLTTEYSDRIPPHPTAPKAAKTKAEYLTLLVAPMPKLNKKGLRPIIKVVDDKCL